MCAERETVTDEKTDTCALAYVFLIVNVALTQRVVDSKMGFHQWNITTHDLAEQNRVRRLHRSLTACEAADFTTVDQLCRHGLPLKSWTDQDLDRPSHHEDILSAKGRSL